MMNTTTQTLSLDELAALAVVNFRWMMTARERATCLDVLIPGGYIDAEGTWYLTVKGHTALVAGLARDSYLRTLAGAK